MNIASRVRAEVGTRWKARDFERVLNRDTGSLDQRFGPARAAVMRREMRDEYRALVPQIPDIGGRRNPWSPNLAAAVWALAVHRVVLRHGGDAQDTGKVADDYARNTVARIPRPLRHQVLRPRRAHVRRMAARSQQRRYPDDWVVDFVDGAGQPFDFGLDVTECAIVKFLHVQGADELAPWMCAPDYVLFQGSGVGMTRTKTLAWGCDRCDFRLNLHGSTAAPWPPEFAERTCGHPAAPDDR
jgi:hypothetical protein